TSACRHPGSGYRKRPALRLFDEHRAPQIGSGNAAIVVCGGHARAAESAPAWLGESEGRRLHWRTQIGHVLEAAVAGRRRAILKSCAARGRAPGPKRQDHSTVTRPM